MVRNLLEHESFSDFLRTLSSFGELHGPVLKDGVLSFGPVSAAADLKLDYSRTLIPPKKYLLPPRENILFFDSQSYRPLTDIFPEIVLLGIHPCDLKGIAYLDKVFLSNTTDPWYSARRKALTLIGLACEPDEYCFCGDFSETEMHCCDLFVRQSTQGFHLTSVTPKGEAILNRLTPRLKESEPGPAASRVSPLAETLKQACVRGETWEESPLWEEFAERCLSCGACSLCCPTCYCFDVRENGALDGKTALRLREWDNCLFKAHGEVAGGINFRKSRLERFHYRYQHKYLGFGPTRGMVSCVGCGRCRQVCPVKIDLLDLFKEDGHDK